MWKSRREGDKVHTWLLLRRHLLQVHRDLQSSLNMLGKGFAAQLLFPDQAVLGVPCSTPKPDWRRSDTVNHGNGRLSVARVICARNRLCSTPAETPSLRSELYLRLGCNAAGQLGWLREISARRLGHSLLFLIWSENAASPQKANQRETNTIQFKT